MNAVNIIFPHQLFERSVLLENEFIIYLIEEHLFFKELSFHKKKIAFHRASMKSYEHYLKSIGKSVYYIESSHQLADIRNFKHEIDKQGIEQVNVIDPTDNWLQKRLKNTTKKCSLKVFDSLHFLNSTEDLSTFFRSEKKSFFQTTFYKAQRKKHKLLLDSDQKPLGGKWTYDAENRKKYPKSKTPPQVTRPKPSKFWDEAVTYTETHFTCNLGQLDEKCFYPIDFKGARMWLSDFLKTRFYDFGAYEDAMVKENYILHHSLLSPLMNSGLLTPREVINSSIKYAETENIPINSLEGFVRQVIGWREFIRGMYICKGSFSRTHNFWKFNHPIPQSLYRGTTGIEPLDHSIKTALKTGYCHHIERLMILGNFMLLCEFNPNGVYKWFMELFIDAYDWVMVPNVYGMCLFADGGTFATKPYIGGSNYIKKMSNYKRGSWEKCWDGLFWRFVIKQKSFFKSNPRTSMLAYSLDKMTPEKQEIHLQHANKFINNNFVWDDAMVIEEHATN